MEHIRRSFVDVKWNVVTSKEAEEEEISLQGMFAEDALHLNVFF